jgi:hypothetical protein
MFWVFFLFPYILYVLYPCHVIQVQNIAIFALDLKSAHDGEHTIFGLLSLANLTHMMFSTSIHLLANDKISFFFMAE